MRITVLLGALLCVLLQPADARPRQHNRFDQHLRFAHQIKLPSNVGCSDAVMRPCMGMLISSTLFEAAKINTARATTVVRKFRKTQRLEKTHRFVQFPENPGIKRMGSGLSRVMAEGAGRVVGGRPEGCPRAFCGCGASLYLFGKIVPALNLAANWLRFPRAEPAPGMVAARRHHVFVLVRHIRGPIWWAHDSNSGHHRTRVHPRSIAGFAIVDPRPGA